MNSNWRQRSCSSWCVEVTVAAIMLSSPSSTRRRSCWRLTVGLIPTCIVSGKSSVCSHWRRKLRWRTVNGRHSARLNPATTATRSGWRRWRTRDVSHGNGLNGIEASVIRVLVAVQSTAVSMFGGPGRRDAVAGCIARPITVPIRITVGRLLQSRMRRICIMRVPGRAMWVCVSIPAMMVISAGLGRSSRRRHSVGSPR